MNKTLNIIYIVDFPESSINNYYIMNIHEQNRILIGEGKNLEGLPECILLTLIVRSNSKIKKLTFLSSITNYWVENDGEK